MIGRKLTPKPAKPQAIPIRGFDDFELRLGDMMRGERATLGKSLLDVQRELKIKASYIAAIENSDVSAFESQGFIAGYVRSYARYLGMDPEQAYADFCTESRFQGAASFGGKVEAKYANTARPNPKRGADTTPHEKLANKSASFVPKSAGFMAQVEPAAMGSTLVLIALISGLGYGAWSVLQEIQRVQVTPVDQAPGVVAELDPVAGSLGMMADAGTDVGVMPSSDALDRLYRPQALDAPILVARDGPISTLDPDQVGVLAPVLDTGFAVGSLRADSLEQALQTVQVVEAVDAGVSIFAVRPAWVRVTAADGTVIFEKILDSGERYTLPQTEEPPLLHAGNSGSVYFDVNGETYGPAGSGTAVAKNVAVSQDSVIGSYAVADASSDTDLAKFIAVAAAGN